MSEFNAHLPISNLEGCAVQRCAQGFRRQFNLAPCIDFRRRLLGRNILKLEECDCHMLGSLRQRTAGSLPRILSSLQIVVFVSFWYVG